jgi:hypothetical protein
VAVSVSPEGGRLATPDRVATGRGEEAQGQRSGVGLAMFAWLIPLDVRQGQDFKLTHYRRLSIVRRPVRAPNRVSVTANPEL